MSTSGQMKEGISIGRGGNTVCCDWGIARAAECQCEAIHLLSPPSAFVAEQGANIEMLLCSPLQVHTAGMSNLCFGLVVNTASPRQFTCCFHHRLRGKENSLKCCCVLPLQVHTGCARTLSHFDCPLLCRAYRFLTLPMQLGGIRCIS